MKRNIVVFERDERYTDDGKPELGFRLVRGILPEGSSPLAIANQDGFVVECGRWFDADQVIEFAEAQSGYQAANDDSGARLWLLKQATKQLSIPDIGAFCAEVEATPDELRALIKDRAAGEGLLPKEYAI